MTLSLGYYHRFTAALLIFCIVERSVVSGRLWPFGSGFTDDQVLNRYTTGDHVSYKSKVKAVRFELRQEIDLFGEETSRLKIYENGLVSRRIHSHASLCPDGFDSGSYLMAFWTATSIQRDGHVLYRQEVRGAKDQKSTIDYDALADEIKRGAQEIKKFDYYTEEDGKSTLQGKDIKSVIVITWFRIAQPYSIFANPAHRNTFQMLIVSTDRGSYLHLVYERLDYYQYHTRSFFCHNAAVAGITEDRYNFQLTSFFYLTPSSLRLHSNIADYSQLGRYVLVLRSKIPQPSPPRLNCFAEEPDPYCKTGLPPKFCEFRPTGRYPHPTFCDKFVLCNGRITDVQECKGLVYNPWIENCDWKHNYQCTNVNIGIADMFQDLQRVGRFQPLFSIRYDILNLNYGIHNNTCVGVPNWGNTIDVSTCDHYLMCSNTRTYRVPCPPSFDGSKLYFNPDKNYCDYKKNVDCKNGIRPSFSNGRPKNDTRPVIITPPPVVTKSTVATTTMVLPKNFNPCRRRQNRNSPDPLSCDHYYTCSSSMMLKRVRCPLSWNGKTLYYDPETNQCRYRHEVKCNEIKEVVPKTTSTPSTRSTDSQTKVPNTTPVFISTNKLNTISLEVTTPGSRTTDSGIPSGSTTIEPDGNTNVPNTKTTPGTKTTDSSTSPSMSTRKPDASTKQPDVMSTRKPDFSSTSQPDSSSTSQPDDKSNNQSTITPPNPSTGITSNPKTTGSGITNSRSTEATPTASSSTRTSTPRLPPGQHVPSNGYDTKKIPTDTTIRTTPTTPIRRVNPFTPRPC